MELVKTFKALSDETRMRILRLLSYGVFHVNEIMFVLNAKQSNISHHLRSLSDGMLIKSKKEGSLIFYMLEDDHYVSQKVGDIIKTQEKYIEHYSEDMKRLDSVIGKRNKEAEEYFDGVSEEMDRVQGDLYSGIYTIDEGVGLFEGKTVNILDIGCGTGRNLPALSKCARKVIGVDPSPKMLQLSEHLCKSRDLDHMLKLGDIQRLPFASGSISRIFVNMVLHHVHDPLFSLKECSRVLNEGGDMLIVELLKHNDESLRTKYAHMWLGFSQSELEGWLKKSGLSVKKKLIKESSSGSKKNLKAVMILAEKKLEVIEKK